MTKLLRNDVLVCALLSWVAAQIIKVLLNWALIGRLDWKRMIGMGGMPSAHTAFFISMAFMVAQREGLQSTHFAIAFCIASVVIYDAMGVRYQTGKQGQVINRILKELLRGGVKLTDDDLQELVGHTPLEVVFGALVGFLVPILFTFK